MKKIILAIAFALASLPAFAQGALFHDIVLGNNGRPAPSPTYRVCTTPGSPCTGFVSIYSDKLLTAPIVNTGTATGDTLGNINFYAAPGDYCVQVSGAGITTYNIGGSSTSCDVRLNGLVSIPASITQGGTGQTTQTAAFNGLDPLTTLGDTLFNDGTNSVRLAGNVTTTQDVLCQTGNGAVSAAPSWCPTNGTGNVVRDTSPSLTTPALGAATATSVNYADQTGPQVAGLQEFYIVAADFTLAANTSLQTITGLTWTMPANKALKVNFSCKLSYSQATAVVPIAFGIQDVTIAPTNIYSRGTIYTSGSVFATANLPTLTTTTATNIVTGTPSAITTIWNADLDGTIEQPSNASTSALNIMASQSNSSDLLTIKRGSYCRIF